MAANEYFRDKVRSFEDCIVEIKRMAPQVINAAHVAYDQTYDYSLNGIRRCSEWL